MPKKKEFVSEQRTWETVKVLMGREVTAFVTREKMPDIPKSLQMKGEIRRKRVPRGIALILQHVSHTKEELTCYTHTHEITHIHTLSHFTINN